VRIERLRLQTIVVEMRSSLEKDQEPMVKVYLSNLMSEEEVDIYL